VTTEVVGQLRLELRAGHDHSRVVQTERLHTFGFDGPLIPWSTFGEHLDFLSERRASPNLAWFVGPNSIRLPPAVSGPAPSDEQAATMDRFMREAMEAGAMGMSTGLEFNPGREATDDELSA
jgi:N-acyl-D-amino-acid deacylase